MSPVGDPGVTLAGETTPLEVEEFLTWLGAERGRSVNTLAAYRRDLRTYVAWLRANGLALGSAEETTIGAYVAHLRATGRAPASVARGLVAVRSLYRFLADEGLLG
ncbi:MAG TPA: site-specific integrase, partial [Acidimicrobiales bacterium]